jgi:hypothetical protein
LAKKLLTLLSYEKINYQVWDHHWCHYWRSIGHRCFDHGYRSAYIGYGSMLLAFALLIPAVRQANALEYLGFWKNVLFCLGIVAIAAAIYSLVWTIYITFINPGAIETFTKYYTDEIAEAPLTGDNLKEAMENVAFMKNIYSTPAFCFLFTLIEPLPVGILLSFLSSTLAHYKNNKLTKAPH